MKNLFSESYATEQSILGAVFLDQNVMDEIHFLEPRDFSSTAHELIFKVIRYLHENDMPIDFITVSGQFHKYGKLEQVGGIEYLAGLSQNCPSSANVKHYANMLRSSALKRRGVDAAEQIKEISEEAKHTTDEDYFSEVESIVSALRPEQNDRMQLFSEEKEQFFENLYKETNSNYIKTEFAKYDDWASGVGRGWLYILAGRPSVGKTAKSLQMARGIVKQNEGPVLFWSQEMKASELKQRVLSNMTGISHGRMRKRNLSDDDKVKLRKAYEELEKYPLYIEDSPGVTIEHIRATARQIKRKHGKVGAIFVDFLTKMNIHQEKGQTWSRAVGEVTKRSKWLAQELDTPFIMLAQLSREGAEEPKMEHLRDSGEIEQDADVIEMLWKHPKYSTDDKTIIESVFVKGRDIGVSKFLYEFQGWVQRYVDFEPKQPQRKG